jgi:hypothetical protein
MPAMQRNATRLFYGLVFSLIVLGLPRAGLAGTITMFLTDLDVSYLGSAPVGGAVFDTIAVAGATGGFDTDLADKLQAASFKLDNAQLGTVVDTVGSNTDDMWGDLRVNSIGASVPRNVINFGLGNDGGTFGFDWFLRPLNNGGATTNFLRLGLTNINLSLTDIPPGGEAFTFTGVATVLSQNLPFGLSFDTTQPIAFSYTAPKAGLSGGSPATGALGTGALTITGTQAQIPEPATAALFVAGATVLGFKGLRRRRAAA